MVVLYRRGEEIFNKCVLDFEALDDMIDKDINVPVKHNSEVIGYCKKLYKKVNVIYAEIELSYDIAYSIQQLSKQSGDDRVIITEAKLSELYI